MQEVKKMNLPGTSIINKVLAPMDKYSAYIGGGARVLEKIPEIQDSVNQILAGNVHMPNITNLINQIISPYDEAYKTAIMAAIGGFILENLDIHPLLTKIAKVTHKGATAYLVAGLAENALHYATHSSEGCDKPGYVRPSNSTKQNFANAPLAGYYY